MIRIDHLDHLVLTVASIERSIAFYTEVLGMSEQTLASGRKALLFGDQKINLHETGRAFGPLAQTPLPGSADLCFIAALPLVDVLAHLGRCGVPVEEGPVQREGATGPLNSVYLRDPDGNLLEISERLAAGLPDKVTKVRAIKAGAGALGAVGIGTGALGSLALGAMAVGALAIGALAVGKLQIGQARIRRLQIDELVIGDLREGPDEKDQAVGPR